MRNPWVAIDATTDRRAWARRLSALREDALGGAAASSDLRDVIVQSWRRSRAAGVDADAGLAPAPVGADQVAGRLETHPFSRAAGAVRELLAEVAEEAGQVVLFCDRDGTMLWIDGDPRTVDAARAIHLAPGSVWSETAAGTNAMGTALAVDHAVQVFSAEHFCRPVHDWTCAAAPVRDGATGEVIGVLDVTGPLATAHPHSLSAVAAAASVAGQIIARAPADQERPLRLEALGRDRVVVDGHLELSARHSELAVLLALRPEGWTAEQLAIELLGDFGKPVSARAEFSRLRRLLGRRLDTQPYRLTGPVHADFLEVERLLAAGRVHDALTAHPGPLLPRSEVDSVAELRTRLELGLRAAVLRDPEPQLLARWLEHPSGRDDEPAARCLLRLARSGASPEAALAVARLQRLDGPRP